LTRKESSSRRRNNRRCQDSRDLEPFSREIQELCPKGKQEEVLVHDCMIPELVKAAPYGVYVIVQNVGWVSVENDKETFALAVETIIRW